MCAMAADFAVAKPLQEVSTFLDSYWNRDQVFRTLQYVSTLCSGVLRHRLPSTADKFAVFSSAVSRMRTTLRLIDDIPYLARTVSGWSRPKDSSLVLWLSDLLSSLSGLLYYPTEHMAWAADLRILPISSTPLWNCCIALWITSLSASILRNLVTMWRTGREIRELKLHLNQSQVATTQTSTLTPPSTPAGQAMTLSSPTESGAAGNSPRNGGGKRVTFQDDDIITTSSSSSGSSNKTRLRVLRGLYSRALLGLVQNLSDMMNAIHYLPLGVLWAGRLPEVMVGVFGTMSSLLGLYKILPTRGTRPS